MPALNSALYVLDRYGQVAASSAVSPLRFALAKFGEALFLEEGTTNLITNPSYESATTGSAAVAGGNAIALSTARAFVGTQSLKLTFAAVSSGNGGTSVGDGIGATLAGSTTYTLSAWVYVPANHVAVRLSVQGAGLVASTVSGNASTITGGWQRITVTFTTIASVTGGTFYVLNAAQTVAGNEVYIDAVQLEQKDHATSYADGSMGSGYAWTGAANASTSTRAVASIQYPVPTQVLRTITTTCRFKVAQLVSGLTPYLVQLGTNNDRLLIYYTTGTIVAHKSVGGVGVSASQAVTLAVGDEVFAALTFDGSSLAISVSVNGGAVVSTSTASTTVPADATTLNVGSSVGSSNLANAPIEEVLVYNSVLTAGEISALAFATAETSYKDDSRIVFSALSGTYRTALSASTSAGTGLYRTARSMTALVESAPSISTSPDEDWATLKVSVPAGSGVGMGQVVSLNGPDGQTYTVQEVFSPSGVYDELYVA